MLGRQNFLSCIADTLKGKGYGEKKIVEVTEVFERKVKELERQGVGHPAADMQAMKHTMDEVSYIAVENAKRAAFQMHKLADVNDALAKSMNIKTARIIDGTGTLKNSKGVALGRAAMSFIDGDPRIGVAGYEDRKLAFFGRYYSLFSDVMENFSKGALGMQRGKAHLPNVVREMFGNDSGDAAAKAIAEAYRKIQNVMLEDFNRVGGSMRKLMDFNMPQMQNGAKMLRQGFENWSRSHMEWLDWDKMRWPNGDEIDVADRMKVLGDVFDTLSTESANKIKPTAMGGRGKAVGNALENHRFLVYKDADAWLQMHEAYGDGTVFDVVIGHMQGMAHKTAMVDAFGPSPSTFKDTVHNQVRKKAAEIMSANLDAKAKYAGADANSMLAKFDKMFEVATRQNAMDPHAPLANGIVGISNVLTAAQLGSIPLLAVTGDFAQTLAVRLLNHMPLISGMTTYLKGMTVGYKEAEKIAARSGYVFDETVSSTYATERFTGTATYGPAVTRTLADLTMRASLINRHTSIARGTVRNEFMGLLDHMREKAYDDLPFKAVMDRYGITADEWDAVRKNVGPWTPQRDANFLRPLDILESNIPNKERVWQKFHMMVDGESRNMVPGATIEAQVTLRDNTRPNTLPGALLHSFSMYKNFPVSMMQIYGRLYMSEASNRRVGFLAALGLGMVAVGAMGVQLKEISKGREPLPMDTASFWGKSLLSGGALGIYGDFLFSGVNEYGGSKLSAFAGPIAGLAGDVKDLVMGDSFAWVQAAERSKDFESKFLGRLVEFTKRNMPGSSLWHSRLVLEREVWDRLAEWADPNTYRKQRARVDKQRRDFGNEYFSPPGSRILTGN